HFTIRFNERETKTFSLLALHALYEFFRARQVRAQLAHAIVAARNLIETFGEMNLFLHADFASRRPSYQRPSRSRFRSTRCPPKKRKNNCVKTARGGCRRSLRAEETIG